MTDGPPIIGSFPTEASQAADYFFSPTQLGAMDYEIIVDGKSTLIGPEYVAGPVAEPLPDGGNHLIQLGAFLSPMSVGTHTVTIRGELAGTAILADTQGSLGCVAVDITYPVTVVPRSPRGSLPTNLWPGGWYQRR